jgi:hypothetical protein
MVRTAVRTTPSDSRPHHLLICSPTQADMGRGCAQPSAIPTASIQPAFPAKAFENGTGCLVVDVFVAMVAREPVAKRTRKAEKERFRLIMQPSC